MTHGRCPQSFFPSSFSCLPPALGLLGLGLEEPFGGGGGGRGLLDWLVRSVDRPFTVCGFGLGGGPRPKAIQSRYWERPQRPTTPSPPHDHHHPHPTTRRRKRGRTNPSCPHPAPCSSHTGLGGGRPACLSIRPPLSNGGATCYFLNAILGP